MIQVDYTKEALDEAIIDFFEFQSNASSIMVESAMKGINSLELLQESIIKGLASGIIKILKAIVKGLSEILQKIGQGIRNFFRKVSSNAKSNSRVIKSASQNNSNTPIMINSYKFTYNGFLALSNAAVCGSIFSNIDDICDSMSATMHDNEREKLLSLTDSQLEEKVVSDICNSGFNYISSGFTPRTIKDIEEYTEKMVGWDRNTEPKVEAGDKMIQNFNKILIELPTFETKISSNIKRAIDGINVKIAELERGGQVFIFEMPKDVQKVYIKKLNISVRAYNEFLTRSLNTLGKSSNMIRSAINEYCNKTGYKLT